MAARYVIGVRSEGSERSGSGASSEGLWAACVFTFMAALVLNWLAPMCSDDYYFFLKGVSWGGIWYQYVTWSGRLVADTLSSLVLGFGNHWADVISSAALTCLIWVVATLGARLAGQRGWKPDARVFLLVFAIYWVNDPHLGQTTFWIVGVANYLWTNVFNFGFALVFVAALQRGRTRGWQGVLVCALALCAGCSNENTGPTTLLLLALLGWMSRRAGNRDPWPWIWLAFMAVGVAVLILAPGNVVRERVFDNREWYGRPLAWRIHYHLLRRFPDGMAKYWEAYLALIIGACCIRIPHASAWRIALLVAMACVANLALVAAPPYPQRALQGAFIYVLVGVAIMGQSAVEQLPRRGFLAWSGVLVCAAQWVLSYGLMARAYYATLQEDKVRVAIIEQAIRSGASRIEIPQYYFTPTLRKQDHFDMFFNGEAMARYYGTTARITEYPVVGPYSLERAPVRARTPHG